MSNSATVDVRRLQPLTGVVIACSHIRLVYPAEYIANDRPARLGGLRTLTVDPIALEAVEDPALTLQRQPSFNEVGERWSSCGRPSASGVVTVRGCGTPTVYCG